MTFKLLLLETTKCQNFSILEVRKIGDSLFASKTHETGKFLFGINPIKYKKSKNRICLRGAVTYANDDLYSSKFDTLIKGINNVDIYYGILDSLNFLFKNVTLISRADCNGIFNIKMPMDKNGYLIFIADERTITAFNSKFYFLNFKKRYYSKLITISPCK